MSLTVVVTNHIVISEDQQAELIFNSGELDNSPFTMEFLTLTAGDNTITPPDVEDFDVHGLAIIPPTSNSTEIVLKGTGSDSGFTLNASRVSVFQFGAIPPASLVLAVADDIAGLRLVWF